MLAKRFKLPIQSFVGKKGKITKNLFFLVKIFVPASLQSRFGVTISAKTAAKAVDRNRIKRSVYDFLAKVKDKLPVADYWISILPPAADLPKEKFMEQLVKLF